MQQIEERSTQDSSQVSQFRVAKSALVQRINRVLLKRDERLKKLRNGRDSRWWLDLGDYYVIWLSRNAIVGRHIDIEQYGRELGVLAPSEMVADQ